MMIGCQKDELRIETNEKRSESILEEIPFNSLPPNLHHFLETNKNRKSPLSERKFGRFGSIKKNIPVRKTRNEVGVISYTFALSKVYPSGVQPNYFDNLVITEMSDREKALILRYLPNSSMNNRSLSDYSGKIEFYDLEGNKLGSISLLDGAQVYQKQSYKMEVTTCEYKWYELCTGDSCVYGVNEKCTTENVFDDGSDSGGGSTDEPSGGGGGTTTSPIPDEEGEEEAVSVDRDTSFTAVDKMNCTYEQLIKAGSLEGILSDFFGEDAMFNITYSVIQDLECNGKTTVTGCATKVDDYNYQAKFDKDYILNEKTPTIFLAQSIIHESVHANLYAAVVKHNEGIVPADTSFEALYEDYCNIKGWQHEIMTADHYRGIMEKAIREVHPHLNDDPRFLSLYDSSGWDRFYEYISYRGLKDTKAGKVYFADTENASLYKEDAETYSTKQPVCDEMDPELDLPSPINDGGGEGLPG